MLDAKTAQIIENLKAKHTYIPKEWSHLATCPDCGLEFYRDQRGRRRESHPRLWEMTGEEKQRFMQCRHGSVICERCGRILVAEDSVNRGLGPVCRDKVLLRGRIEK